MMNTKIVIIGGVAAGMSAASKAIRTNPEALVEVYTDETYISYSACSLPFLCKNLISNESSLIARNPEQMKSVGVCVYTQHKAVNIDPEKKKITVIDPTGQSKDVPYDKLIIATGARNFVPSIDNVTAPGVFTIKSIPDIHRLQNYILDQKCKKTVIIGGGFIGLEMADALHSIGLSVTMVEKTPQIMPILDEDIAGEIQDYVEECGIRICCNTEAQAILITSDGKACGVKTQGKSVEGEVIILAIGLLPNTNLAAQAGIELGVKRAIRVDQSMRTNIPDIYAAGDCAATLNLVTGKETSICLGTLANRNGKVAGENAAGGSAEYLGEVGTSVFKIFEREGGKTGLSLREAKQEGLEAWDVTIHSYTRASGYPGRSPITVKLVVEQGTNRLLGGQIFGGEGAAKRIDVIAAYVQLKQTIHSLAALDMGYAPPFSPVWDPVLIAANQAVNKSMKIASLKV